VKAADTDTGRRLRIAFVGMRGLPADLPKAGGGERETEAKATRLAQRGHEVVVYCRWHYNRYPSSPYYGVRLISLPSIPTKNFDTVSHSLLATLHALFANTADILSFHGMGNGLFVPLARLAGKRTVVYMDGVDWERPKWGALARVALRYGAGFAFRWADAVYVDNRSSQDQFRSLFGVSAEVITLAADSWGDPGQDRLAEYNLESGKYILFVGLLKPDKGVHILVEAYEGLDTDLPLVIVGDSPDGGPYVQQLKSTRDRRIRFLGYVYGKAAQQLFANCYIYVQPSLMEGNSPALMSAMACGRCVVVSDIEQNLETIGATGVAFRCGDGLSLRQTLTGLLNAPEQVYALGRQARERIDTTYNWDIVVNELEKLYRTAGSRQ
jgi:glycosyltransferase involved in cell wall biosynthesis